MKQTLPWNVTGIPPEAREVARTSAHREGITVGEWLTRRIVKERAEGEAPGEPAATPPRGGLDYEALHKIHDALGALSRRLEASDAAQSESRQAISDRIEAVERHADAGPLRDAVKGLHLGLARLAEEITKSGNDSASQITTIADNVEILAGQVASAHAESREGTASAAARLADFETRLQQSEREFAAVLRLEERFSEMEARLATSDSAKEIETKIQSRVSLAEERMQERLAQNLASLQPVLENLGARLEQAEMRENPASTLVEGFRALVARLEGIEKTHRESLKDFETKLAGIANRIEKLETSPKPEAPLHPAFAPLEGSSLADPDPDPVPFSVQDEPLFGQDIPFEPRPHALTDDYLAHARRAAQTASTVESEHVKWRGRTADALASLSASAEHSVIRRAAKAVMFAALVLFVIGLGLQLSSTVWRVPGLAALQRNQTQTREAAPAVIPAAAKSAPSEGGDAAIAKLTAQAEAGDAKAALALGLKYANGDGAGPDDAKAARWLTKAAQAGEAVAQYRLGTFYEKGRGVGADPSQAIHWYGEAAKAGNRKAMHNLAVAYANGTGGRKNLTEAVRWFRTAAELGMTDSQFNLAVLYERGLGVKPSLLQAYAWYAIAAAAGDAESKARTEALAAQIPAQEREAADNTALSYKPRPMNLAANDGP